MRSFLVLRSDLRELQDFHKKAESVLGEQRALPWQPCAGPDLFQRENTDLNPSLLGVEGRRKSLHLHLSDLIFLSRTLVCAMKC